MPTNISYGNVGQFICLRVVPIKGTDRVAVELEITEEQWIRCDQYSAVYKIVEGGVEQVLV